MATPTLGAVPTVIDDAESITGWLTIATLETDLRKEGSNSMSGKLRNDLATGYYDYVSDGGSALDLTGEHVRVWVNFASVANLDTEANNGMEFWMYDGTNTAYWVVFGSDTYSGGWANVIVDCDSTPDSGSYNKTIVRRFGLRFNRTSAPKNTINTYVDLIRYGTGYYATGGTSGDKIDLAGIASVDDTNAYGIVTLQDGVFFCFGELTIGNGATTTWFEIDTETVVWPDKGVANTLYGLVGAGSGCRVDISQSVLRAAGTARVRIDMSDTNIVSMSLTDSFILTGNGACSFDTGQTVTGNVFIGCGQITHGGADMTDSLVTAYEGAANSSALVYNQTADPDGEMDGMGFTKGTAATHAIEFGLSSPLTMTLRDVQFTGYNALNNQNDSALHVKRTSGTVTINIVGGNLPSYRSDGATVVVQASVSVTIKCIDVDTGSAIEGVVVNLGTSGFGSTDVIDNDTTNASGEVTATFSGSTPQAVNGYAAKGSASPVYKRQAITATISASGLSQTVPMSVD